MNFNSCLLIYIIFFIILYNPANAAILNKPFIQIFPTIDPLLPTGLPTGLQQDCLYGLRITLRYVLVLPFSSFS